MKGRKTAAALAFAGVLALARTQAFAQETQENLAELFYTYTQDNVISEYYAADSISLTGELLNSSYDAFLALLQTDLNYDGTEELLAIRIRPQTTDEGETENAVLAEVYERNENSLQRICSYTLAEGILNLNESRTDVFLVSTDLGLLVCCEADDTASLSEDGIDWSLRGAAFNGESFTQISSASLTGSSFTDEQMSAVLQKAQSLGLEPADIVWQPLMEQVSNAQRLCLIYRYMTADSAEIQSFLDNPAVESMQYGETRFKNYVNTDLENKIQKEFGESLETASKENASGTGYSYAGDYVIADSDSRYITTEELDALSEEEIFLARNEIYARHGRKFNSEALSAYFNSKSWYEPTVEGSDFTEEYANAAFNDFEITNISTIVQYEQAHGLNGYETDSESG